MDWTKILKQGGVPEPPGYVETVAKMRNKPKRAKRAKLAKRKNKSNLLAVISPPTQPPPFGGFVMPQKRIFNDDSKTALEPLCLSSDELIQRLAHKDGLQELILQNNRDHIISGKTYNTTGYVLQLVEYLGRKCTVGEIVAASDGALTERSVNTGINRVNGILYPLVGLRLTHVKDTGEVRLVNESDALMATEKFAPSSAEFAMSLYGPWTHIAPLAEMLPGCLLAARPGENWRILAGC